MLTDRDVREIFRAFILTGQIAPTAALLQGLASVCGKSEKDLREQYCAYWTSLTGSSGDPFAE